NPTTSSKILIPSKQEKKAYEAEQNRIQADIERAEKEIHQLYDQIEEDTTFMKMELQLGNMARALDHSRRKDNHESLLPSYQAQRDASTQELAATKEFWYQKYGAPFGWKKWEE
ncbi:hypothetical protein PanWU01x14_338850, partial [Parasponia andersonii]